MALLAVMAMSGAAQSRYYPQEAAKLPRGEFIFFSNAVFPDGPHGEQPERKAEILDEIKRYRVCLTNGYVNFQGEDLKSLHKAGCELFLYLWFNGYYQRELAGEEVAKDADIRRFPEMFEAFREMHRHPDWLLNPEKPISGAGAVLPAFFYDYNNPGFRKHYTAFIKRRIQATGYNGVFFDYIGSWALPEEIKTIWKAKHPGTTYDEAGAQFLKELKEAVPGIRLFGNQAYRLPPAYYDHLDYDVSESHGTSFVWGKEAQIAVQGKGSQTVQETFYRLWDGPAGYKQISEERRRRASGNSRVKVFDINYLQPRYVPTGQTETRDGKPVPMYGETTDRAAIFYGYALSKLTNAVSYASDWYAPGFGRDDLYLLDLGEPLGETFEETNSAVVRYFRKGFVVITRKPETARFTPNMKQMPPHIDGLWDVYEGTRVGSWPRLKEITIQPGYYPATQTCQPSGRVYLYLTGTDRRTANGAGH